MKNTIKILAVLLILGLWLAAPGTVMAGALNQSGGQTIYGDQLIFGNNYSLQSGQTLQGDLVVMGGNAQIEQNATVNGDIVLLGGNLDLTGTVNGDVVAFGANISLEKGAYISNEIVNLSGTISGAENATIRGGIQNFSPRSFQFDKGLFRSENTPIPNNYTNFGAWLISVLGKIMQILAMAVLAVIVLLVMPKLTKNVADTVADQPWMSGGAGLLTFLATPLVLLILGITIILIPVAILAILALAIAAIFGWIAIGYELGKRIAGLFRTEWADAVSGGIGTLVLGIVVGLLSFIPCLGAIITFLVVCAGLGGVVLSGFGTRPSSFKKPAAPTAAAPLPNPSPAPEKKADANPPGENTENK